MNLWMPKRLKETKQHQQPRRGGVRAWSDVADASMARSLRARRRWFWYLSDIWIHKYVTWMTGCTYIFRSCCRRTPQNSSLGFYFLHGHARFAAICFRLPSLILVYGTNPAEGSVGYFWQGNTTVQRDGPRTSTPLVKISIAQDQRPVT